MIVEPQIDEGIDRRYRREGSAVLDRLVQASLVGCDKRGAIGPIVIGIGRRVNGEDDIHIAIRLYKRIQRNVLQIFTAIDKGEAL